jgi:hypothetical protein
MQNLVLAKMRGFRAVVVYETATHEDCDRRNRCEPWQAGEVNGVEEESGHADDRTVQIGFAWCCGGEGASWCMVSRALKGLLVERQATCGRECEEVLTARAQHARGGSEADHGGRDDLVVVFAEISAISAGASRNSRA